MLKWHWPLAAAVALSAASAAQAQTAPGAPVALVAYDFTTITTPLLQLLGTLLLGLGAWAIRRLLAWLGLKTSEQAAANLDQALGKAVTFGIQQAQASIKSMGWDDAQVRSQVLTAALPYMMERFADTIRSVGGDPTNGARIREALDRAFPQAVMQAVASPGTPPVTAPNPQTVAGLRQAAE